jgi:hypothetical protein
VPTSERSDPPLADPPGPTGKVPLARIAPVGHALSLGVAVVIAGLVVAIVKPWAVTPPTGGVLPTVHPVAVATATPGPASTASPAGPTGPSRPRTTRPPGSISCYAPDWRAVALFHTAAMDERIWVAVDPARAVTGPDDPLIPVPHQSGELIDVAGFCAPPIRVGTGPDAVDVVPHDATVWRRATRRPAVRLTDLRPIEPSDPDVAETYRWGAGTAGWPGGTYVFSVIDPAGGPDYWFGLELEVRQPVVR